MRCREVRKLILPYLEGDPALDARGMEDHLASCARCAQEEQQLREALEGLPPCPEVTPPPALAARIKQHVATSTVTRPARVGPGTGWRQPATRVWAFTGAAIVVLFGAIGLGSARWWPGERSAAPPSLLRIGKVPPSVATTSNSPAVPAPPLANPRSPKPAEPEPARPEPEAETPRTAAEAVAKSQQVAQSYGYLPRDREGLATICRAYYDRSRGPATSRGKKYAVRIATFACRRYAQAQEIAAVLDAAGLPTEIAPCRDGQVLVGVYVGPASLEAIKSIHREKPGTVVVPYEEIKQDWARLGNYLFQSGCLAGSWSGETTPRSLPQPGPDGPVSEKEDARPPSPRPPVLIWGGFPAAADYVPTHIEWKDWRISSSENLYAGQTYTRYPLTHLVDGDPRTAWVFSGTGTCREGWESRYAVTLSPREPVVIDSLWLMNGYNKSRAIFLRNNRVVQVRLSVNGKRLKTARLSDKRGWHQISLPRQAVKWLQIELTEFRQGRDDDVCLSELALYNNGHKIAMRLPEAVLFRKGCKGGGSANGVLLSRSREILAKDHLGKGGRAAWSPNGRSVTSVESVDGRPQLWVADVTTGQVIFRKTLPQTEVTELRWQGNQAVEVTLGADNKRRQEVFKVE